jgi:hypothetical protein
MGLQRRRVRVRSKSEDLANFLPKALTTLEMYRDPEGGIFPRLEEFFAMSKLELKMFSKLSRQSRFTTKRATRTVIAEENFPLFMGLPAEIREDIWKLTLPDKRHVKIQYADDSLHISNVSPAVPAILHVSQESRQLALRHLILFFDKTTVFNRLFQPVYLRPKLDVLFIDLSEDELLELLIDYPAIKEFQTVAISLWDKGVNHLLNTLRDTAFEVRELLIVLKYSIKSEELLQLENGIKRYIEASGTSVKVEAMTHSHMCSLIVTGSK